MKTNRWYIIPLIFLLPVFSCNEEKVAKLPPVEERTKEAIANLRNDLTTPSDGWKLEYQPTDGSGVFFILLDFSEEDVRIRTDLAENGGEFFDHTIPWRVDNAMGLELIFETYGIFHYLFEQDGATFGAEFEWTFMSRDSENLIFRSISDFANDQTTIILEPASPDDDKLFAREIAVNLNEFSTISPKALIAPSPKQQLYFDEADISIFWSLDPAKRIVETSLAGTGTDFNAPDFRATVIDHISGYKLEDGSMVLLEPLEFVLNNTSYSINEITFSEFSNTGPGLCSFSGNTGPLYKGQVNGMGNVSMSASLFDIKGMDFQPIPDFPYSVNSFFIFDGTGTSLSEDGGLIAESFPNASGFVFYYGFESPDQPANAVGFILDNGDGTSDIFVREFLPTETIANSIHVELTDNYFHSGTPAPGDKNNLDAITDILFEGGDVYASDFPVEGLVVFNLFNPCNEYEMFLVQ